MPTLTHVAKTAASRGPYIYAFYRLCKLHNVSNGSAEDFNGLAEVLRTRPEFRAAVFRLAASVMEGDPELKVDDVVVIVALAAGGAELSGREELEAPDDLMTMFQDVLTPEEDAHGAMPSADAPLEESREVDQPRRSGGAVQPIAMAPRQPVITQQALLAEDPEHRNPGPVAVPSAGSRTDAEVAARLERLENEREDLNRQLREMELMMGHLVRQIESMPARVRNEPHVPPDTPQVQQRTTAPVDEADATREHADAGAARASGFQEAGGSSWHPSWQMLRTRWGMTIAVLVLAASAVFAARSIHRTARSEPSAAVSQAGAAPGATGADDWSASDQPSAASAGSAAGGQAESQITDMLAAWASASARNDPAAESAFYAPTVDRYFLRRDVSRDFVLREKQDYRRRGNTMQSFKVSDVAIEYPSASKAVVTLTKWWSVTGPQQTGAPHSTRSRLWLDHMPEGWRITGEQDLRSVQ